MIKPENTSIWMFHQNRIALMLAVAFGLGEGVLDAQAEEIFAYPNFTQVSNLLFFNAAQTTSGALRLTPAQPSLNGSVFYGTKVRLVDGFDAVFQFRITNTGGTPDASGIPGGDGLAFMIQKQGVSNAGPLVGYIPYSIPNALAVEIDTWQNSNLNDPAGDHLSVQWVGPAPNGLAEFHQDHSLGTIVGSPYNYFSDGSIQSIRLRYRPGQMRIYFGSSATNYTSYFAVPVNLTNVGGQNVLDADGKAFVGFGAGTGAAYQTHDVLSWQLTTTRYKHLTLELLMNEQLLVSFSGDPTNYYALEQTHDLSQPVSWLSMQTNQSGLDGTVGFTNTLTADSNFYWRVRSLP